MYLKISKIHFYVVKYTLIIVGKYIEGLIANYGKCTFTFISIFN